MLTAYFEANKKYEEARELTYIQFPSRFVYNSDIKAWTPRKQGTAIGRAIYVHPAAGDTYYLRIILNVVKGSIKFAKWILDVGNGTAPAVEIEGRGEEEGDHIKIGEEFLIFHRQITRINLSLMLLTQAL
ncbi:unnamed protein product [Brassica oleracea var. botrytis]